MDKYCANCGTLVTAGQKHCTGCGIVNPYFEGVVPVSAESEIERLKELELAAFKKAEEMRLLREEHEKLQKEHLARLEQERVENDRLSRLDKEQEEIRQLKIELLARIEEERLRAEKERQEKAREETEKAAREEENRLKLEQERLENEQLERNRKAREEAGNIAKEEEKHRQVAEREQQQIEQLERERKAQEAASTVALEEAHRRLNAETERREKAQQEKERMAREEEERTAFEEARLKLDPERVRQEVKQQIGTDPSLRLQKERENLVQALIDTGKRVKMAGSEEHVKVEREKLVQALVNTRKKAGATSGVTKKRKLPVFVITLLFFVAAASGYYLLDPYFTPHHYEEAKTALNDHDWLKAADMLKATIEDVNTGAIKMPTDTLKVVGQWQKAAGLIGSIMSARNDPKYASLPGLIILNSKLDELNFAQLSLMELSRNPVPGTDADAILKPVMQVSDSAQYALLKYFLDNPSVVMGMNGNVIMVRDNPPVDLNSIYNYITDPELKRQCDEMYKAIVTRHIKPNLDTEKKEGEEKVANETTPAIQPDTTPEKKPASSTTEKRMQQIPVPDVARFKKDLVGKSMPDWTFKSVNEFKSCSAGKPYIFKDQLTCPISIKLIDTRGEEHLAKAVVTYIQKAGGEWVFANVKQIYFN